MVTIQEKAELARLSREDGKRFYTVVEGLYRFLLTMNWITGAAGGLIGLILFIMAADERGFGALLAALGILVWGVTAFVCAANYVGAVLATHCAKILVHILFSNIAIMEGNQS